MRSLGQAWGWTGPLDRTISTMHFDVSGIVWGLGDHLVPKNSHAGIKRHVLRLHLAAQCISGSCKWTHHAIDELE